MKKCVAQVVFNLAVDGPFDYEVGAQFISKIAVGKRVRVMLNRRVCVGFVVAVNDKSDFDRLSVVLDVLDSSPSLDKHILELTKDLSEYYGCCWGEVISLALPKYLRMNRNVEISLSSDGSDVKFPRDENILIYDESFTERWNVIFGCIKRVIDQNRQVIFIVPEVIAINGVINKIKKEFPQSVIESMLAPTDKKEWEKWNIIKSQKVQVVVGARSSIFAPLENVGLIVVYSEEHEHYKQEQTPYYHLRDVALMRGKLQNAQVCLVSSAPTSEAWHLTQTNSMQRIDLLSPQKAKTQIIDMTNYKYRGAKAISAPLLSALDDAVRARQQSLLFLNQLEYNKKLRETLSKLFPTAIVAYYDKKTESWPQGANIIVATQAVLKVREKIKVDLTGVFNIDADLHRFDFRSTERTFALLTHLRQMTKNCIYVQTQMGTSETLQMFAKDNVNKFYDKELETREEFSLPPFTHFVAIMLRGKDEQKVLNVAENLYKALLVNPPDDVELMDLHPDVRPIVYEKFRFIVLLKSKSVKIITQYIKPFVREYKKTKGVTLAVNVDP